MITTSNPINGRGCGFRSKAGVYLCFGIGPGGRPIEDFVIDPVRVWPGDFQRGFKVVPTKGDYNNVVIFVGESFYKSCWDFVEEARRFGASRKVTPTFPIEQLTPGKSNMIFVHPKAFYNGPYYHFQLIHELSKCRVPKDGEWLSGWHNMDLCTFSHRDLSYYFHQEAPIFGDSEFRIDMPSFSYTGFLPSRLKELNLDLFTPGAFLALPLSHIEFPFEENDKFKDRANKSGFETIVTDW